jgi:lysophospholipase L1-like esterase
MVKSISFLILPVILFFALTILKPKPAFYIIGDSTVRNGDGTGKNGQWGWGSFIADYFDTNKISISNQAIGGRSSRTFITEKRWEKILGTVNKGDYVIMQFGHNDGGPLDDTARARGSLRGIGNDSTEIYNPIRKMREVVHSYGWYMRKYVREAKAKGAIPIVCSPIPHNDWENNKVKRWSEDSYAGWARQIAKEEGAYFIDLNNLIADKYEELGPDKVKTFFPADHTHTNLDGGKLNAEVVINAIRKMKPANLQKYLLKK